MLTIGCQRWNGLGGRMVALAVTVILSSCGAVRGLSFDPASAPACQLPPDWAGDWFQADEADTVQVNRTSLSNKGTCAKRDSNGFYVFRSQTRFGKDCFKCMAFFPKHRNLLLYKETVCESSSSVEKICSTFQGDLPLKHLFRLNPDPAPCPVQGPIGFNYEKGLGKCGSRPSSGDFCAQSSRIRLNFAACPETSKIDAKSHVIECLGEYEQSSRKYFIGRMLGRDAKREGDNFRCFMHSSQGEQGQIGISADATCQELTDWASVAEKVNYHKKTLPHATCKFDHFLRAPHGSASPREWDSLEAEKADHVYRFRPHAMVEENGLTAQNVSFSLCIKRHNTSDRAHQFTVFTVDGCESGYQCIRVFRRDRLHADQVVEIQRGALVRDWATNNNAPYVACSPDYIDPLLEPYETLILRNSVEKACPDRGLYLPMCGLGHSSLSFGCDREHQFVVNFKCSDDPYKEVFNCHGYWSDGRVNYLVGKEQHTGRKACFVYAKNESSLTLSAFYKHSCERGVIPGVNGVRTYNASVSTELCSPAYSPHSSHAPMPATHQSLIAALLIGALGIRLFGISDCGAGRR